MGSSIAERSTTCSETPPRARRGIRRAGGREGGGAPQVGLVKGGSLSPEGGRFLVRRTVKTMADRKGVEGGDGGPRSGRATALQADSPRGGHREERGRESGGHGFGGGVGEAEGHDCQDALHLLRGEVLRRPPRPRRPRLRRRRGRRPRGGFPIPFKISSTGLTNLLERKSWRKVGERSISRWVI